MTTASHHRNLITVLLLACAAAVPGEAQVPQLFPLGNEFQVNTSLLYLAGSTYQSFRTDVAGAGGRFVVVWESAYHPGDDYYGVAGQRFAGAGSLVGGEFLVNTYTDTYQRWPAVAADRDGDFVVVWESSLAQDGDYGGVFGQRYGSSGAPAGGEFQINTYTTETQYQPDVAADDDGDFVVVWASRDQEGYGYGYGIFGQRYASSGARLGTEFQANTYVSYYQYRPAVDADADGDFVVVWQSYAQEDGLGGTGDTGIFAQRFASSGAPVGTEFQANAHVTASQTYPAVGLDGDGDFVIAWQSADQDLDQYGIFAQRFSSSGAPRGSEFQVNASGAGDQLRPDVAAEADGDFTVAWEAFDTDYLVMARRYASSGAPIGTEFQVNDGTTSYPLRAPAVASLGDGDFVVAWDSYADPNDANYDAFSARHFVVAHEVANQNVGGGTTVTTDTECSPCDGSTSSDRVETTVTTPNGGPVTIVEKPVANQPPSGYTFVDQQVNISAPPASPTPALTIVFELDRSLFPQGIGNSSDPIYRNGVAVPNCAGSVTTCTGGPTVASPDPCVANRCLQGDLDVQLTVLTSSASEWNFAMPCTSGFTKGLFLVKENVPGKEKLIAKLIGGPPADSGSPRSTCATGGTVYRLRVYDDAQTLVADVPVDRAGDTTCSGGATNCWKALGGAPPDGKGYKYKDTDGAANGVTQIMLKSSGTSSKMLFKAKGPAPPFPGGIAAALSSTTSVTIELHGDGAPFGCLAATLADIKTQESDAFKAK